MKKHLLSLVILLMVMRPLTPTGIGQLQSYDDTLCETDYPTSSEPLRSLVIDPLQIDPQPTLLDRLSQFSTFSIETLPMKMGRPMTVTFDPFRPGPSDQVSAVITGRSAALSLTPGQIDVDINGNFITIDIHWLSASFRLLASSASLDSVPAQTQSCGGGAMYEPVPIGSTGGTISEKYEVVQPLGTFSPGMYTVEVNSLGTLTGTVTATFTVYQPSPNVPLLPDPWSLLQEPVMWFDF